MWLRRKQQLHSSIQNVVWHHPYSISQNAIINHSSCYLSQHYDSHSKIHDRDTTHVSLYAPTHRGTHIALHRSAKRSKYSKRNSPNTNYKTTAHIYTKCKSTQFPKTRVKINTISTHADRYPASQSPIYGQHHTDSHAPQHSAAPTHPQINSEDTDNHHTDNLFSHRFHRSTRNYRVRLTRAIMTQPLFFPPGSNEFYRTAIILFDKSLAYFVKSRTFANINHYLYKHPFIL